MHLLVYGPGRLGTAITTAAVAAGWSSPAVVRRPVDGRRPAAPGVDVVIDASAGSAVLGNVEHALEGGNRAFVLAATGWEADLVSVRERLRAAGAAAVIAPNLSLGAALFARLVETAARWYAAAGAFEPSIVEWHRAGKADRPSGTARAIARRIVAVDPRWVVPDEPSGWQPPSGPRQSDPAGGGPAPLEVVGVRAGGAPGTHLVTFDGPGESVELRLTARDRSAYADGALAAAGWLVRERPGAGLHPFDAVIDDLVASRSSVPA
jgi:4-hydroxy-tetrahydrodipicolinate reductase